MIQYLCRECGGPVAVGRFRKVTPHRAWIVTGLDTFTGRPRITATGAPCTGTGLQADIIDDVEGEAWNSPLMPTFSRR
jgi:hypothetical protein